MRWFGDTADWRHVAGMPVPGRLTACWSDEPAPWFELQIEEARADVPTEDALAKGRRAIAQARRRDRSR